MYNPLNLLCMLILPRNLGFVAIAMGVMAVAGSFMSKRAKRNAIQRQLKAEGKKEAGAHFALTVKRDNANAQLRAVKDNGIFANIRIASSQAQAKAAAEVAAATTGVEGTSVDQTISQSDIKASEANKQVARKADEQALQSRQDLVDATLNNERNRTAVTDEKLPGALDHALAFGQGFAQGGGFG